jgi:DNA-binding MarR family transcriptional regulator
MTEANRSSRGKVRLAALARQVARAAANTVRAELAANGFPDVAPAHNAVFAQLSGGGARVTDMAAGLGVTKQAVTMLVNHLDDAGYVHRVDDEDDGRAKLVQLTERGRAAAAVSLRAAERLDHHWAQVLGADRLAACKEALEEVLRS